MKQKIDCFLACHSLPEVLPTVELLRQKQAVRHVFLLVDASLATSEECPADCSFLVVDSLSSSYVVMQVAERAQADYVLLSLKPVPLTLGALAVERLLLVAQNTGAAMIYADRYTMEGGERRRTPSSTIRKVRCATTSTSVHCCCYRRRSCTSMPPATVSATTSMPDSTTCASS